MEGLRHRLLRWLLLPLVALTAGSLVVDYDVAMRPANDAYDEALSNTALALSFYLQRENGQAVLKLTERADAMLRADRLDRIAFAVFDAAGRRIGGDSDLPYFGPADRNRFDDITLAGQPMRVAVLPHRLGDEALLIEVAETTHKRDELSRRVTAALAGPNLALILITLVLVGWGIEVGLKPLERLRQHVAARSAKDLTPLPHESVPEELQPLIEALNRQFALLAEALSSQERFLADAAHQLKTPLAALQSQLELAIGDADPASRQHRLFEMQEALHRVTHLAHQLLALARAEPSAGLQAQRQAVHLPAVAERMAQSHLDRAIDRGIDLGFELEEATVEGVPWLLNELLANLVDNALAYVPTGSHVTVRCGRRGQRPFLEVEDDGPGIPSTERNRVFERFYRMPESATGGCGLGLAIVRDIAAGHGATVEVREGGDGQGVRFTVSFPVPAATAA
ncbi:sensor histidine kinase N-terminal domain-containing protein [Sulfurisoma sediminicola]|uniref:histidine kinase n=1 Tax=Sulfurisoma sediminicola TaxID=1381557 RepID=A0A497XK89_9PROT|nr:sensor histidine kinase N-terminal domain-containing protein [Sulfurisoma sediminicola]RLJ67795.1 two-component system sensor histidine kinase TctE [Sulfurisoma sediminicola]